MDDRSEIQEFLASRRARITPEQAGLPAYGGNRRVKGLRREEAAMLAGVSVDYYVRLERGNLSGASDGVLDGVARALHLDDAEREHLFDLARRAPVTAIGRRRTPARKIRPVLQHMLDAISHAPAWIRNDRHDLLAANPLALALYAPVLADPRRPANTARFIYLDPAAKDFFTDWDTAADDIAAMLRAEAGRNPHDKDLTDLIGELSTRSETFRRRWADHNVRHHRTGIKKLHHPAVGHLELHFEAMTLTSDPGLTLLIYTAAPGTPSADNLRLLATFAATRDQPAAGRAVHEDRP
ncbi:helix-turn-helix transcriptional regulator [Sphaerisporangium sp. NPDC049002]|uniref:helix-turn-helix transcriptional regulator n=1 Tax=unclassified Sphaerisporangium TaxID=2630420 RepID=UPI0033E5E3BD